MTEVGEGQGFAQILEHGAMELKSNGEFTTKFSASGFGQMMRQVFAQSEEQMKRKGISAQIDSLNVRIENGKGEISTAVTASKKLGFWNPKAVIQAALELANVGGEQASGRLLTTRLDVKPESLFGIVRPREFLAPLLEGEKINDTFGQVLGAEFGKRGARVDNVSLLFTPDNKLQVTLKGGAK